MGFTVRKASLVMVLTCLLLFTVFGGLVNVTLVRGIDFITINADGSVDGTTNITSADNVTYTFTGNITGYITVARNNIVIDGAGYTLEGAGDQDDTGIYLSGITNVTVRNTRIVNFEVGVWVFAYSNNNTVTENTFVDNRFAIELSVSSYNTVSENVLTDNGNGIWLDTAISYDGGANYNSIVGNNITLCFWDAIGLANESSNNTIVGNNMVDNGYGISISSDCDDNTVSGNNMDSGIWGISLESQCNQNSLIGNNITNADAGIYIYRASNNSISGNNIVDNDDGVLFYESADNKFWHNNFIDNTEQIAFSGDSYANVWDDGYPSGGNYWSDYAGSDADGDGIGDSAYTIDGNNIDHYPLMAGFGIPVEKSFPITVGETEYVITTVSNSSVTDLSYNQTSQQLTLSVSGPSGTTGFCNITVPAALMSGNFTLYLDDVELVEGVDYIQSFNGTHYTFSVTYTHSTHEIKLAIPDFASWLFLPFLMSATIGFALRKRLKKPRKLV